ncbi:helix-turn-helix transcriptional regulator [Embleya hyalina]|uniref:helix-turn-helix transcriptional regulator n=1 Tax=Embleya hyalina TaxID=516124 RepID=UPI001358B1E5|nr:LuxR family transcriptional regulator [Embleya hyalina]
MRIIDQESELNVLESALADCLSAQGRIVLVEGAAGCGKSELIEAFADRAVSRGATVLFAAGSAAERDVPLGVLRQLLDGLPTLEPPELQEQDSEALMIEAMRELHTKMCGIAESGPVVCCVDNLQHVDAASRRFLQYMARHSRSGRILLVASQTRHYSPLDAEFTTELMRRPELVRIQLQPLTATQVATAAARFPGLLDRERLTDDLYRISGGNPLLLRALASEHTELRPTASAERGAIRPQPGGAYARAVVTCLQSCGQNVLKLAAATIVLGPLTTPALIAQLVGITRTEAAQGMSALKASGLLHEQGLRHPVVTTTVVDHLAPGTLAAMHRDAAELLYESNVDPNVVARHLLDSHAHGPLEDAPPWASGLLRAVAEEAVKGEDVCRAITLLELAHDTCVDAQKRVTVKLRLSTIAWRVDPGLSERYLSEATEAVRAGTVSAAQILPLLHRLTAQGRIADALEMQDRLSAALSDSGRAPTDRGTAPEPAAVSPLTSQSDNSVQLAELGETHSYAALDANTTDIERFLATTTLSTATIQPIVQALITLTCSEEAERCVDWCQVFLEQALGRATPGWQSLFSSMKALVLLRLGDLEGAEEHALESLARLPDQRGSNFAFSPISTLLRARTEMGNYVDAAALVEQSVPDSLHLSIHGLAYFRARARYYLATRQFQAALSDLYEAGRLMKQWGMDRPTLLPWRTEAAEVLLEMGHPQRAERLVLRQLSMVDARNPWVRGTSLRLRAATSEPKKRLPLLQQAIMELRKSGDRVQLARAMADLSETLVALGDPLASLIGQEALALAAECKAAVLHERILRGSLSASAPRAMAESPLDVRGSDLGTTLSESEQRVAALAALKYTNREISGLLHITVSTVEQHLTRVYRKLNISRRQDLPTILELNTLEASAQ